MKPLIKLLLIVCLSNQNLSAQYNPVPVNCTPLSFTNCNLITNNTFNTNNSFDPNNLQHVDRPFELGLIDDWYATHGTPQNSIQFSTDSPPFTGAGVTYMGANATSSGANSEGIIGKLVPLIAGHKYGFSFFRKITNNSFFPLDFLNISLMKCDDYDETFLPMGSIPPTLPSQSQIIYCETNISSQTWEQIFVTFIANDNYDMIHICPKENLPTSGWLRDSYLLFSYPELIDITNFSAGLAPNISLCPGTKKILGPNPENCSVRNSIFTWKSPSGGTLGNGQQISVTNSSPSGNYTLEMTVPTSTITNNSCSNNSPVVSNHITYYNSCSPCFSSSTISPSGPIKYWNQYETNNGVTLTSSAASTYQWYKNNLSIQGATNQTLFVMCAGTNGFNDTYTCVTNGCELSNPVNVEYIPCFSELDYPSISAVDLSPCASDFPLNLIGVPGFGNGTLYEYWTYNYTNPSCYNFQNISSYSNTNTLFYNSACNKNSDGLYFKSSLNGAENYMFYWLYRQNCKKIDTVKKLSSINNYENSLPKENKKNNTNTPDFTITSNLSIKGLDILSTNQMKSINLYNSTGQLIKKVNPNGVSTISISIADFPMGLYIIEVIYSTNKLCKKIIIE